MQVSPAQAAEFTLYARKPETWAVAARRQLAIALHLFEHRDRAYRSDAVSFEEKSGAHYAAYLQSGYAVENAAKAALVAKDPNLITDRGTIDRSKFGPNAGHGLLALVGAAFVSISDEERLLLEKLQEYVVWAGRYTVPMNASALFDTERMNNLRLSNSNERTTISTIVSRLLTMAGTKQ